MTDKMLSTKHKYEIHVNSTKKAKELRDLLEKNNIDFNFILDESMDWVFVMYLTDEQLPLLQGKKSLEEIIDTLISNSNDIIDKVSANTIMAAKKVSPAVSHCVESLCVTAVKVGAVIVNEGVKSYHSGADTLANNNNVQKAKNSVVSGTAGVFSWVKSKF